MKKILGDPLRFDWKTTLITIVSTLLLMVDYYFQITPYYFIDRVILFLVVPWLITIFIFRESPQSYGASMGDWKAGALITLGGMLLMTPIIWFLARSDPSMRSYYQGLTADLPWSTYLDLIGWEFFFRGWILFGYERKFGTAALWLQAVPFALAHIGKPPVETFSTIFGGFAFGWIAYRTRSFIWPFLIHWYIATLIILLAAL